MSFKYKLLGEVRMFNEIEDILKLKGITDIDSFLNPTIKNVESELLLDNIQKARDVLVENIKLNNVIDLLIDCDCDGFSSASVIYQYIKRINSNIQINIFLHKGKVHGLSDVIDEICQSNSSLVIVPDAGTGDSKECAMLYSHGKEVIILDHHDIEPDGNPAIIVNNQLSPKATDKSMTGVGIVYKFIKVLDKYYNVNYADDYLDLVAFGMIGDRADVTNLQTRYLILEGIKQLKNKSNKNILLSFFVEKKMYSMNNNVTMNGIAFYINPLVNSMIRLGDFEDKKILFEAMCNSNRMIERKVKGKGMVIMSVQEYSYKACESSNNKQKKLTEESSIILSEEIDRTGLNKYPIIVCNAKDNVDGNSTGLIAGRLSDQYQRPCLLMRRKGDMCKGSGRGNNKCEILDFNKWCKETELFEFVNGHDNAFGVGITFENTNKLLHILSTMDSINEPTYHVSGIYNANQLSDQLIKNVAKYHYVWGGGIDEPLFLIRDIQCNKYNLYLIGSKQNKIEFKYHNIKFTKMTKGSSLAALYKEILDIGENIKFTVVGRFSLDMRDNKCPQVIIEDLIFEKSDVVQGFGI